jgi:GNAT superfamily N-acetyltransferase
VADVLIRRAGAADAAVLARHRAEMFRDMGELPQESYAALLAASQAHFAEAIPAGRYHGWVAVRADRPEEVVAGVGLQLIERLPRPDTRGRLVAASEGYVFNVFTERAWRRRGVAERLMQEVIAWARARGIRRLALHASAEGRLLYQKLGFVATNEMRCELDNGPAGEGRVTPRSGPAAD